MKLFILAATTFISSAALAQQPPKFLSDSYPAHALKAVLQAQGVLEGKEAKLDPKVRQLIALGVAAQIPCTYCVYIHTKRAQGLGASEAEIREAVATAAIVRHWSTVLNGMQVDFDDFKAQLSAKK